MSNEATGAVVPKSGATRALSRCAGDAPPYVQCALAVSLICRPRLFIRSDGVCGSAATSHTFGAIFGDVTISQRVCQHVRRASIRWHMALTACTMQPSKKYVGQEDSGLMPLEDSCVARVSDCSYSYVYMGCAWWIAAEIVHTYAVSRHSGAEYVSV